MHALPPDPHEGPIPSRWHCTKKDHFFFSVCVFFSRIKAVCVDYFDFNVCLVMHFFIGHGVLWLQQYIGHNGLNHTELSMDSVILTVCEQTTTKLERIWILKLWERLSFKYSTQKTTPVSHLGQKWDLMEFAATTNNTSVWTTTPLVYYNKRTVWWLILTYQCGHPTQIKSHSLYINIGRQQQCVMLSFPFVSLPSSVFRSMSLIGPPFTSPPYEMQELRAMIYHRIGCKACVYMVVHIRVTSAGCYCLYQVVILTLFFSDKLTIQTCRHDKAEIHIHLTKTDILGKHSVWHAEIKIIKVQLKLYECMGQICSI